jgi:hypothetical protein
LREDLRVETNFVRLLAVTTALACVLMCDHANRSLFAAPSAPVQQQRAALRLAVRTGDGAPIDGAEVTVKIDGRAQTARTGAEGRVRFEALAAGLLEIRVRHVGYAPARLDARIADGENELTVRLIEGGAMLDEIRVIGNRPVSGIREDFDMRVRQQLANASVTRDQIEKRSPIALSQMLRGVPGLRLADSAGSTVAISNRGLKFERSTGLVQCVLRVAVDGTVLPSANIDAVLPREVYGVEVYFGPARIPPQFSGIRSDSWCGLIAVWTRRD